jgi:hypothetical protein
MLDSYNVASRTKAERAAYVMAHHGYKIVGITDAGSCWTIWYEHDDDATPVIEEIVMMFRSQDDLRNTPSPSAEHNQET